LPIGKWTQDYKAGVLEAMMTGSDKSPSEISDFKENHTDTTVSFTVTATKDKIDEFEKFKGGLHAKFKLSTTISTNNMTAFDIDGKLHKYATTNDILRVFFDQRLEYYIKRKALLLEKMRRELKILDNKARFVEEVCSGDLVVSNRKRAELLSDLQNRGYDLFPKEEKKAEEGEEADEEEDNASDANLAKGYEYLLGMKIWSLTFERAEELRRQLAEKTDEVASLEATEPQTIWLNDLSAIEEALDERDVEYAAEAKKESQAQSKAKVRVAKQASAAAKKAKKASKKKDEWDSDVEMSDEDDDDDFVVSKPAPKPKAQPKKVAAPKPAAKPADKPVAVDEAASVLEKLSIKETAPVPVLKPAAPAKKVAAKAPAKKAPAKKAAPKKKSYDSSDDSDDFMGDSDSDVEVVDAPPARNRSARTAAKPKTYVLDDSSDDDSEFEF
jgi:DNA topoisomerase-2